jgi:hypothetical protein
VHLYKIINGVRHKSYIGVIRTDTENIIEKKLYKNAEEILAYFKKRENGEM